MKKFLAANTMLLSVLLTACGSQTEQTGTEVDSVVRDATPTTPAEVKPAEAGMPFSKTVTYKDFEIAVSSDNEAANNTFKITSTGFKNSNLDEETPAAGKVTDVLIDDIDGDDAPEVFVITRPAAGGLATIYGYSANKDLSMSGVSIPSFKDDPKAGADMTSGDEYALVENNFIVRFPLYENGTKTAKTRQLQYKLQPGEAQKKLVFDRVADY
jgi:hypothetical protein